MARPDAITRVLLERRAAFKAFLVSRLGNEAEAEDLLQNGLVKALERADGIQDGERAVAWFYQLLRNSVVDHVRSRSAAVARDARWTREAAGLADDPEAERHLCACFERIIPTLKPAHAELLRRVELAQEPVAEAARALGITPNNASVTLHRARAELRTRLVALCGDCRCLEDCDCD